MLFGISVLFGNSMDRCTGISVSVVQFEFYIQKTLNYRDISFELSTWLTFSNNMVDFFKADSSSDY